MSHLASADCDAAFTEHQVERFRELTAALEVTKHLANSAGTEEDSGRFLMLGLVPAELLWHFQTSIGQKYMYCATDNLLMFGYLVAQKPLGTTDGLTRP